MEKLLRWNSRILGAVIGLTISSFIYKDSYEIYNTIIIVLLLIGHFVKHKMWQGVLHIVLPNQVRSEKAVIVYSNIFSIIFFIAKIIFFVIFIEKETYLFLVYYVLFASVFALVDLTIDKVIFKAKKGTIKEVNEYYRSFIKK